MNPREKAEHNAIKYLVREIYQLDKDFDFKFPQYAKNLQPYAMRMRGLVENTLDIAGAPKIIGHELKYPDDKKKKDNEDNE